MDHANYERTGKLEHSYFLIEDNTQWEKKHSWDHSYSDAMMECAQMMVESYGLMLEIPGAVQDAFDELAPWSKCSPWAEAFLQTAVDKELYPDILLQADMTQAISREEFAAVWRYLRARAGEAPLEDTALHLSRCVARTYGLRETFMRTMVCLEVLSEQGLIQVEKRSDHLRIRTTPPAGKVDLESSSLMRRLRRTTELQKETR